MKPLEPPDSLHLQSAQGWCELHAFAEADAELDNITASLRAHPSVLEVRWQVYANLEKWAGALDIASAIVKLVPDWPSGWIYRASSL
jgi:predicted Zn-dependent protease